MSGINRANKTVFRKSVFENASYQIQKPCIFLSHISIDKRAAIEIGEYITDNCDIDIYLDIYDTKLQRAVINGDNDAITNYIENGLNECSHVICILSNNTKQSWWVPYEIGFAKQANKDISTLSLKDIDDLPSYLEICRSIRGTKSFNHYLATLKSSMNKSILFENATESLISHTHQKHPLDAYLKWKL